ncbi:MAG TPA: hypothetical protein VII99_13335 [Bacteroidia bacterium]
MNAERRRKIPIRHFALMFFIFHFSFIASSQVVDSIVSAFHKRPGFTGGISSTNTFINGFLSPIYTASAGLDFDHRIRIGAGISWLQLSSYKAGRDNSPFYLDNTIGSVIVHPELKFTYADLFIEYVYFDSKKWQFSVPIHFGIGDSRYQYNYNGQKVLFDKHTIVLYQPVVSGAYKLTKWFGIGMDVGYRIMIVNNKNIGSKFNSPVLDVGVVVFWSKLYRAIFPKSKLLQKN